MTPVFCCGFECGILAGVSPVGEHWSNAPAAATISTSIVRSGSRSLRINASSQISNIVSNANLPINGGNKFVIRFYIYFTSLPNTTITLGCGITNAGSNWCGAWFNSSDSKIYAGFVAASLGATGVSVTTGQWYLIDVKVDISGNPWTIDVQVNNTVCGQRTNAVAANTFGNNPIIGPVSSTTCDMYYDDVIFSATLADYPIGAGHIDHFVPASDGTHTATGVAMTKDTIGSPSGGAAITSATTDAFSYVNGVPLLGGATDNTRLINNEGSTGTVYTEVVFGNAPGISTPTAAPRAVEVITADRQAATTVGVFSTKLVDNTTESVLINRTGNGVITDRYVTKQYATPPTGGAWAVSGTSGNFKLLKARFGYSTDANPDQYWRGIMIEAEFLDVTPWTSSTNYLMLLGAGT